ncbi:hypothetical protein F2Q69_00046346 [Brassica cretica]|uniref:Uncharacterized protein n=1 Tax=Brassica cretica TaxID=69181 RepID=A0A8S9PU31_BRACR|nr:hypothetical protein F2Q69_00046346 [Brassica cretica]
MRYVLLEQAAESDWTAVCGCEVIAWKLTAELKLFLEVVLSLLLFVFSFVLVFSVYEVEFVRERMLEPRRRATCWRLGVLEECNFWF